MSCDGDLAERVRVLGGEMTERAMELTEPRDRVDRVARLERGTSSFIDGVWAFALDRVFLGDTVAEISTVCISVVA